MSPVYKIFAREPVFLGKAIAATVAFIVIVLHLSDVVTVGINTMALAWIGWGERLLSTPEVTAQKRELAARNQTLADVNSLVPPPPLPKPKP